MAIAQAFSQEEVKSIIENVDGSSLIDEKTKKILHFSEKITQHVYKVIESDIHALKDSGCSEEEISEAVAVASLFNDMDRMADALGVPVEGFQKMMAQMLES